MTRILHVFDHSLPKHSGYTFRSRAILKAQQRIGLDVRGITGRRHQTDNPLPVEEVEGLLFHRTPGRTGRIPVAGEVGEIAALTQSIVALGTEWRPDILHAHSPALCGAAALRASRRLGIPLVYEIRAFWEDAAVGNGTGREGSFKYRLTRALENNVVSGADAVFTICHGLRDDLIERGFAGRKIGISPNGVDLSLFGEPLARDADLADELGFGKEPVIGFIGSFYDYEGLDDLIAAIPHLHLRYPDARLLLVGGGPCGAALRKQAARSGLANHIHFTGRVPHDQVDRYYSLIDILAYPRKKSRLTDLVTPLKPLEAMAQQRIVAASDVGGHRELITDGATGKLFPADDPELCGHAIADLLDNQAGWDEIRNNGRIHVATHHDWSHNIIRYQSVYYHLLAQADAMGISAVA